MGDPRSLPADGQAGLNVPCVAVNLSPLNFQK